MRLHRLNIAAFGPFGAPIEIDFDDLNAGGQFLISGPTGSGKTSILDAICFAFYGSVPGERQKAKHLRSDHAPIGATPCVTLTSTVAGRMIRIVRSPAWDRPKKRGEGTILQQASVRVEEFHDGEWSVLATRLDEAGHLISGWLGMTATQFTQVAMLPQGGFQTFLQAPSNHRHALLQQLFRTDRFEHIERWFVEHRRALKKKRDEASIEVDNLCHRFAEALGLDPSDAPPSITTVGHEQLADWVSARREEAAANHRIAQERCEHTAAAAERASSYLDRVLVLADRQARALAAHQTLTELEETQLEFDTLADTLAEHRRAETLSPLLAGLDGAVSAAAASLKVAQDYCREADIDSTDGITTHLSKATRDHELAQQILALTQQLTACESEVRCAASGEESAAAVMLALRDEAAALPALWMTIEQDLAAATQAVKNLDAVQQRHDTDLVGLGAAHDVVTLLEELKAQNHDRAALRDRTQHLRQSYLDAREARIEAHAAELAAALVVGCSCPVCGSTSHPSPARSTTHRGREEETRARELHESSEIELSANSEMIAVTREKLTAAEALAHGRSVTEWQERVEKSADDLTIHTASAATLDALVARRAEVQTQQESVGQRLESAVQNHARRAEIHTAARKKRDLLGAKVTEVAALIGPGTLAADLSEETERLRVRLALLRQAADANDEARQADRIVDDHTAILQTQAAKLGFNFADHVRSVLLADTDADAISRRLDERDAQRRTAEAFLAQPDVAKAEQCPAPDLTKAKQANDTARVEHDVAESGLTVTALRDQRGKVLAADLNTSLARFSPLAAAADTATALSALLEGTGVDNRLRMRLSAYVLTERLRRVVEAANGRLAVLTEGRYVLFHREERSVGDVRGGLSLSILDEWTGSQRDPATLSGGETFIVSLCLALGLADTVADESGGLRLESLFVDEGFGSLDSETLDAVVDILARLSAGGRVTGIVSHVGELRERLPAVLDVIPSRNGSIVRKARA